MTRRTAKDSSISCRTTKDISKAEKIWIWSMEWCGKYCHCHQMPERSFFIGEYQLPLCARCTGLLIGHIFAVICTPWQLFRWWIPGLLLPMAIDGTRQWKTAYISNNLKRVTTGILYGFSFTTSMIFLARYVIATLRHTMIKR